MRLNQHLCALLVEAGEMLLDICRKKLLLAFRVRLKGCEVEHPIATVLDDCFATFHRWIQGPS
jgi:hypothetical protein